MNDFDRSPEAWEQSSYRTGQTRPPKSWGGLVAVLLVCLIFLGGLTTALGFMNIKLFHKISQAGDGTPVSFSRSQASPSVPTPSSALSANPHTPAAPSSQATLGFATETITSFLQLYYKLPQGVYIVEVTPGSEAAQKHIVPGDVLLSVDGVRITESAALDTLLHSYSPGDTVQLLLHRSGREHTLELTLQ